MCDQDPRCGDTPSNNVYLAAYPAGSPKPATRTATSALSTGDSPRPTHASRQGAATPTSPTSPRPISASHSPASPRVSERLTDRVGFQRRERASRAHALHRGAGPTRRRRRHSHPHARPASARASGGFTPPRNHPGGARSSSTPSPAPTTDRGRHPLPPSPKRGPGPEDGTCCSRPPPDWPSAPGSAHGSSTTKTPPSGPGTGPPSRMPSPGSITTCAPPTTIVAATTSPSCGPPMRSAGRSAPEATGAGGSPACSPCGPSAPDAQHPATHRPESSPGALLTATAASTHHYPPTGEASNHFPL
jgi:hypothetical protein